MLLRKAGSSSSSWAFLAVAVAFVVVLAYLSEEVLATTCHCDCCLASYSAHPCDANFTQFGVQTCTSCSLFECLQRYPICVQNFKLGVVPRCLDEEAVLTQIVFWVFMSCTAIILLLSVLRFYIPAVDQFLRWGETTSVNSRRREHSKIKKERLRRVLTAQ